MLDGLSRLSYRAGIMKFTILSRDADTAARRGELSLYHGKVQTPVFMPVATRSAIRAMPFRFIEEIGFEIILSNTYHLYIRPGMDVIERMGGLHSFMKTGLPILTDSGGFQVFSLSKLCKINDKGAEFSSHLDGSKHFFTPEKVLDIQKTIGSDVMMILDQCVEYPIEEQRARDALERTVQWAKQSIVYWKERFDAERQTIFAIAQGSTYPHLRRDCAKRLADLDFPGYAIGGLSVGEPKDLYREITEVTANELPWEKPRYMMGVGSPMEILDAVKHGIDMFDCVMPTRIARNGTLYTTSGKVNIKLNQYQFDESPIDPECGCFVCQTYSKSYLRHILRAGEIAALVYNTHHNLYFMKHFMADIRDAIAAGRFTECYEKWRSRYGEGTRKG
ncbi:MAG TPA: tRNA guanosine(34) transglycosylase Tgt [Spirochaetota bacterium]